MLPYYQDNDLWGLYKNLGFIEGYNHLKLPQKAIIYISHDYVIGSLDTINRSYVQRVRDTFALLCNARVTRARRHASFIAYFQSHFGKTSNTILQKIYFSVKMFLLNRLNGPNKHGLPQTKGVYDIFLQVNHRWRYVFAVIKEAHWCLNWQKRNCFYNSKTMYMF